MPERGKGYRVQGQPLEVEVIGLEVKKTELEREILESLKQKTYHDHGERRGPERHGKAAIYWAFIVSLCPFSTQSYF